MKFVQTYSEESEKWLRLIEDSSLESNRTRNRAKAIRLSAHGFSINQLMLICSATHKTISGWIDKWEQSSFDSLLDAPGRGRRPIIPESEHSAIIKLIEEEPRQLKRTLSQIQQKWHLKISLDTLKRILKKTNTFGGV